MGRNTATGPAPAWSSVLSCHLYMNETCRPRPSRAHSQTNALSVSICWKIFIAPS